MPGQEAVVPSIVLLERHGLDENYIVPSIGVKNKEKTRTVNLRWTVGMHSSDNFVARVDESAFEHNVI